MSTTSRIWLRTNRAARDQTQDEAAAEVGVSRGTWYRWSTGKYPPTLEQSADLARWASCSIDDVAAAFGLLESDPTP